jgi:hypothetical protein
VTLIWADSAKAIAETGSSYSTQIVDDQGAIVEGQVQAELDMNGLSTNPANIPGSGVGMLVTAAQNWLCRNIRVLQKHDNTHPNSLSEGTQSVAVSIDASIKYHDDKGREALDKYIASQTGTEENEQDQYAGLLALAGEDL